jgi:hypothetical protein
VATTDASVTLSGDRRVVLQISNSGPRSARHWATRVISVLDECGLAVIPCLGHATDDLEAYLAHGHPVLVAERQDPAEAASG